MDQAVADATLADGPTGAPLTALVSALAPGQQAVVARLLQDNAPRFRDPQGRRACPLTPSGAPYEASLAMSSDGKTSLRFTAVAGDGRRYFTEQLAVQQATAEGAAGLLPAPAARLWREGSEELFRRAFPTPARVPARTRLVSAVGVQLAPDSVASLRLYANLAADRPAAMTLAADWLGPSAATALQRTGAGLHLGAVEVGTSGERATRLYVVVPRDRLGDLLNAVGATRAGFEALQETLHTGRVPLGLLSPPCFLALSGNPDQGLTWTLHLRGAAFEEAGTSAAAVLAHLVPGLAHGPAHLERWERALAGLDGAWEHTVVGLSLRPDGGLNKLNAYAAPSADPRDRTAG